MQTWLAPDILATFPVDYILLAVNVEAAGGRFNKAVRLLRVFKLLRIMRVQSGCSNLRPAH